MHLRNSIYNITKKYLGFVLPALLLLFLNSCRVDPAIDPSVNTKATPYNFPQPDHFPPPLIPADNPMTVERVELGRMLFYDKILSGDSSMSCADCHKQELAFSSGTPFDIGIHGVRGTRSSMAIFNLAWVNSGFFWDGRARTVEMQASMPVPNPVEMDLGWPEAVKRLQRHHTYPLLFQNAFGTQNITQDLATKAIAQFMRSIVSADSKFDKTAAVGRLDLLTESEMNGFILFNSDPKFDALGNRISGGADCAHCHGNVFFQPSDDGGAFRNNGLDSAKTIYNFKDFGVGGADSNNYGRFKTPSLRNIALTAPYMHDGRFKTLEQVIDHYNKGGKPSPTLDQKMARIKHAKSGGSLQLTDKEKKDIIAFLRTLTDSSLITNKAYSNPFIK